MKNIPENLKRRETLLEENKRLLRELDRLKNENRQLKEKLEIVSGSIEAQGGQQAKCSAVSVREWVNMYELKLGDAAYQHRMDIQLAIQPSDQIRHHYRDFHS